MSDIEWTGDLSDDCTARWQGLVLRAEAMNEDDTGAGTDWWWAVSDGAVQVISNGESDCECSTGAEARRCAEEAAREYRVAEPVRLGRDMEAGMIDRTVERLAVLCSERTTSACSPLGSFHSRSVAEHLITHGVGFGGKVEAAYVDLKVAEARQEERERILGLIDKHEGLSDECWDNLRSAVTDKPPQS